MKTILKGATALLLISLFFGCSKDDSSAPSEVVKTKVKITRIDISSIPQTNSGTSWDSFDNPDMYIKCYDEFGTFVASSTTLWNFIPSISSPFSVSFPTPIETTDLTNTILKVQAWDDDSDNNQLGINPDDKIGEVPFYIQDYTIGSNKYPSYAVKSDGVGTIVTIYMTWE